MQKSLILTVIFGMIGGAILLALGVWQVQRLTWKEALLAEIETRISAEPVALPEEVNPEADKYLPVVAEGTASPGLRVLVSVKHHGPGYRMISVFETGGRRILLDRGFLSLEDHTDFAGPNEITVTGNLHWPDEVDGFTPEPDLDKQLWFARDVPAMAAALGTEPVMIIARRIEPSLYTATPLPVSTQGIANDHLGYAITWFSLAVIWLGMTAVIVWRIRRRTF